MEWTAFGIKITVPGDYKLVKSDGSVVGDEVCLGDQFKIVSGETKGEYWQDGGVSDSPPIQWVDDVDVVFEKVIDYLNRDYTLKGVPSGTPVDGFVDPVTGVRVYNMGVGGNNSDS